MDIEDDQAQCYLKTTILTQNYLNHLWSVDLSKLHDSHEVFSAPFKPRNREEWILALRRPENPEDDIKLYIIVQEKLRYKIKVQLEITIYASNKNSDDKTEIKKLSGVLDLDIRNRVQTGIKFKTSPLKLDFKMDFYFSDKQSITERLFNTDHPPRLQIGNLKKTLLRMLEDGFASDITFKVRNTTMKAHSYMIADRCDFLYNLIQSEAVNGVLVINSVEPNEFKHFLRYLYTNSIEDESSDVVKVLYSMGCKFSMPSLTTTCKQKLISEMTPWNAASLYNLADLHNDWDFSDEVFNFIKYNLNVVSNTEDWTVLPHNLLSNS